MSDSVETYVDAAKDAARRAARILADWRQRFTVSEKGRCDFVTEADLASQKAIQDFLCGRFPNHHFLGEEGDDPKGKPPANAPPTWIVDPIDGTTNYVHDVPLYCISIGLLLDGELSVGVIYDPCRDEMFAGALGKGAWLNERRLHTSSTGRLDEALLSTGFPPDMRGQEMTLDWWRVFSLRARSLRRTGSTALNLAYVAAGRFDGYWAFDNKVWDVAAAAVLVREAGGTLTNWDGSHYEPFTPDALVSNGPLHPALLEAIGTGP
jgi:myo-inositol-1(or 4)-monophosphatase